jgi:hypothetical protein
MKELGMTCGINRHALIMAGCGRDLLNVDAWISVHQAQVAESLEEPLKVIEQNEQAYRELFHENPQQITTLCHIANNLGYSHSTVGSHEKAKSWFETSEKWWHLAVKNGDEPGDRPARHIVDHARCLVHLKEYAKAENMLDFCISRLKTEYPLDWAMLAQ